MHELTRMIEHHTPEIAIETRNLSKMLKASPQAFGRYAAVLQNAAKRGSQSLATTHFVLQQKDQEYRKMVAEMDEGRGGAPE